LLKETQAVCHEGGLNPFGVPIIRADGLQETAGSSSESLRDHENEDRFNPFLSNDDLGRNSIPIRALIPLAYRGKLIFMMLRLKLLALVSLVPGVASTHINSLPLDAVPKKFLKAFVAA
jgi:hypothetical protein